jgi:hypothetical protein
MLDRARHVMGLYAQSHPEAAEELKAIMGLTGAGNHRSVLGFMDWAHHRLTAGSLDHPASAGANAASRGRLYKTDVSGRPAAGAGVECGVATVSELTLMPDLDLSQPGYMVADEREAERRRNRHRREPRAAAFVVDDEAVAAPKANPAKAPSKAERLYRRSAAPNPVRKLSPAARIWRASLPK